jgi:Xaa-Pro aminopeptidase
MKRRDLLKTSLAGGSLLPFVSNAKSPQEKSDNLLKNYLKGTEILRQGPLINFEQAYRVMHEEELDGLIVSDPVNLYYFTGYYDHLGFRFNAPTAFALLSKDEKKPLSIVMNQFIYYFSVTDSNFNWDIDTYLFTGWDKKIGENKDSSMIKEPQASPSLIWKNHGEHPVDEIELNRLGKLNDVIKDIPESVDVQWALTKAIKNLELDSGCIGIDHSVIKNIIENSRMKSITLDADHALRKIRIIKSFREIELMKIAAQSNAEAALAAVKQVKMGATYHDLKSVYFRECSMRGNIPYLLQMNTVNSEVFNREFKDGDAFMIDAVSQGFHYTGDYGRTIFIGEPKKSMINATKAIAIGWDAVREKLKPGLRYSEIRKIGRDAIKKAGFDYGCPVTPHSVGLFHTDEPGKGGAGAYWEKDDLILQENMIISVDMPVLNTGIGGSAHLEDLTLITKDGGEQINDIGNRTIIV